MKYSLIFLTSTVALATYVSNCAANKRRPALGKLQDDSAPATPIDINTSGFAGIFFIVRLPY